MYIREQGGKEEREADHSKSATNRRLLEDMNSAAAEAEMGRQGLEKPNMITISTRTSATVQDVRIREIITIGEGTGALIGENIYIYINIYSFYLHFIPNILSFRRGVYVYHVGGNLLSNLQ